MSYKIIIFEIFIFSDLLELNRNILREGSSILITAIKDISNSDNRFKRVNVKKIVNLKDLSNISFDNITLEISNYDNLEILSNIIAEKGDTNVKIKIETDKKNMIFELSNKRKINKDIVRILKKEPYLKRISY